MTSSRPYLLRALYEWISDNRLTPYIVVSVEEPAVQVPMEYVTQGQIVLNIARDAICDLIIDNAALHFHASFSRVPRYIFAPIPAVLAIYAQENGEGMVFGEEPGGEHPPDNSKFDVRKNSTKKPQLKVIK